MAINEKKPGDCGYVCFYKGKRIEVYANGTYAAQKLAAAHFKAKKSYDVNVILAERADGSTVEHTPTF